MRVEHKYCLRIFEEGTNQNNSLLGCDAGSSGNFLPTFRDNLSVPSLRGENSKYFPEFLIFEDGTDRLSRNFGKKSPLLAL